MRVDGQIDGQTSPHWTDGFPAPNRNQLLDTEHGGWLLEVIVSARSDTGRGVVRGSCVALRVRRAVVTVSRRVVEGQLWKRVAQL
jgi:hypothetical protein